MASNINSSPTSEAQASPDIGLSDSLISVESSSQRRKRKVLTNIEPDIKKLRLNYGNVTKEFPIIIHCNYVVYRYTVC